MSNESSDELYLALRNSGPQCNSLLKKYLTPALYQKYKNVTTNYGGSLRDCLRSGEIFYWLIGWVKFTLADATTFLYLL